MAEFCNNFNDMFICHRKDNSTTAHQYLCGLFQADRSNMERMEEKVADSDYESLQQFISNSPWNARSVMNRVAEESDKLIGGTGMTGLLIDESAFAKKGKASVGVGRQWNGRLGKTDNSQVAVFGVLSAGERAIPVDVELFLPSEWTDDRKRCEKSGVPEDRREHKTKPELGMCIVKRQRELGTRFDFVCGDGLYGNSMEFCTELDDTGEIFLVHVHADKLIYLDDPKPVVPPRSSSRGRTPTNLKAQTPAIRADHFFKQLSPEDFEKVTVRKTSTGVLTINAHRRKVWIWDEKEESARAWTLFIRQEIASPDEIKYCLTNAAEEVSILMIARMEAQRFWIERSFEDAKSQAGMADYQIRGWRAWHHHMALVMMAMLFMTKQRMMYENDHPLLSCYDIKVMLAHFLPRKDITADEVLRQMEIRHAKRRAVLQNSRKQKDEQISQATFLLI